MDLKALGIRIPVKDIKNIRSLAKNILSLLFVSCNLRGLEINDVLRELLTEINNEGPSMVQEIKDKMIL
jgi:hypothetical protein